MCQVVPTQSVAGVKQFRYGLARTHFQHEEDDAVPSISVRYNLLPIAIVEKNVYRPLGDFLTGLLSMIGGVYALAALTDSGINIGSVLMEKRQLGKLG